MCGGGGKSPRKPPEPLKDPKGEMLEARDEAAKKQRSAAGFAAANKTKGKLGSAKLGGGSKLGGAM
jgi:hypothetical protein